MTSHRGAYLHSLGVIAEAGLSTRSAYLWTLPMFHCNGWAYTWAVTATGARHLCLPAVEPEAIWRAMLSDGVTHMCAAPTVVTMMLGAASAAPCPEPVQLFIGGAPPAPALLERASQLGIEITHLYGLTETYGPFAVCAWNPDWDRLSVVEKARLRSRQGVSTVVGERLRVVDERMHDVPRDGITQGEVVMRGNNVMLGYYRDPEATSTAFSGGWFHSGDLAVMHPDGYVELRDRLKDVVDLGWREHRHDRNRAGADDASRTSTRQLSWQGPTRSGGGAGRVRHDPSWGRTRARAAPAVPPRTPRRLQDSQGARGGRRAAQDRNRQDPEVRPAPAGR